MVVSQSARAGRLVAYTAGIGRQVCWLVNELGQVGKTVWVGSQVCLLVNQLG